MSLTMRFVTLRFREPVGASPGPEFAGYVAWSVTGC